MTGSVKRGLRAALVLSGLVALAGILLLPRVRVAGVDLGVLAALRLAALGKGLEPVWGLLSIALMLVPAALWGMAVAPARATVPADTEAPPTARPSPRAMKLAAAVSLLLFFLLQATMAAHIGVTQALKHQAQISGPETTAAGAAFLRHAYYGNYDAAYSLTTRDYRQEIKKDDFSRYLGDWRAFLGELSSIDPLGYFYGLGGAGPYTGIDYRYEGSKGGGMLRMHLIRENGQWQIDRFQFAVSQGRPKAVPPAPGAAGPAPAPAAR